VDRQGKETPLPLPPRSYLYPHLSPDGKQLALEIEGPSHNFYLYDFLQTQFSEITGTCWKGLGAGCVSQGRKAEDLKAALRAASRLVVLWVGKFTV
jgi:hypothetical protein